LICTIITLETALKSPGLVEYLHSVFARIVEEGRTYPMEVAEGEAYSRQAFESYFFAADVIVGVLAGEGSGDGFSVETVRMGSILSRGRIARSALQTCQKTAGLSYGRT
jgi:hypothetical protein